MIEPRYQSDRCTLFCADCLDVLPQLEPGSVDAVVTDPPYGVNVSFGNVKFSRRGASVKHPGNIINDDKPFDPAPFLNYPTVVMCGANNYANRLPSSRGWIFWHKRPGMKRNDFGDGEIIWTNKDRVIRYYQHTWNGVMRDSQNGDEHYHPTEKPIALMSWLIEEYCISDATILDPFMGSGTTGVAAMQTGRKFIGVEIDPAYYAIAEKRIRAAESQLLLGI